MEWKQNNVEVTKPFPKAIGFIYSIQFEDGTKYLGKKNLYSTRKRKFGKKEAALVTDKRKKLYEMVTKESDWRKYNSSNPTVKEKIINGERYEKIIIQYAFSPKELTYLETKWCMGLGVLEKSNWINDNILGKFFKSDVNKWEQIKK